MRQDIDSGRIVDFVLLKKGQMAGDIEKHACETIRKMLCTKYSEISHEFDVCHISKSLQRNSMPYPKYYATVKYFARHKTNKTLLPHQKTGIISQGRVKIQSKNKSLQL
ncbi:hypothetical protein PR048_008642 [Dryococelus australis]|uniref:Uncharacterized protein n=1 Tax=Dryococelus australis TaxID=614101 RepID=A0ABQ9HZF6_9NEOP|nr:hypothetical protein PR048_008642 [Dryococelus australis]